MAHEGLSIMATWAKWIEKDISEVKGLKISEIKMSNDNQDVKNYWFVSSIGICRKFLKELENLQSLHVGKSPKYR